MKQDSNSPKLNRLKSKNLNKLNVVVVKTGRLATYRPEDAWEGGIYLDIHAFALG